MFERFSLDQLTVLLTVVDEGSFSAAGRRLGRVQSAVSHAIAGLEDALGTKLFDRTAREPVLTDPGRRLAAEARLVVSQARALRETAATLAAGVEPRLDVVLDPLFPEDVFAAACAELAVRFPAVSLRVETELLGDAVRRVEVGADLGLCNVVGALPDALVARALGSVRLVWVCAPGHPLGAVPGPHPVDLLRRHVQIVLSERSALTDDQGVIAARTWRVTDLATRHALLLAGTGWGSMPERRVADDLAAGRLVRVTPERWPAAGLDVGLTAVVRADRPLGPAGRWLRDRLVLDAP